MILPRGITGFWSVDTEAPPVLEENAFCRMCHMLARENGGTAMEVDTDRGAKNFYSARICRYDDAIYILQNAHYLYAAFAQRDASGGFVVTDQPEWLRLPENSLRFLSAEELNRDWQGLCGELSPEEREQIRYWKPQTVGDILFNTWD